MDIRLPPYYLSKLYACKEFTDIAWKKSYMHPDTFATPVSLQMKASIDKIDESPWDKEPEPFQTSIELSETSTSAQSSNRAMKMWKAASFSSQSSGTDVDLFEVDWDLCFICQIAVRKTTQKETVTWENFFFWTYAKLSKTIHVIISFCYVHGGLIYFLNCCFCTRVLENVP